MQGVALGERQTFWAGSQTCGETQSALVRQATQLPVDGWQRGVGFAQLASEAQEATQWWVASQLSAARAVHSAESRHCTQAWCCRSQTGAGGAQSLFAAQPGSTRQVPSLQSLPGPQSRATRQAMQVPWATSHTGVAGCVEQSASRAQLPASPGAQQPLAQCWPEAQAASPLHAAEPTHSPLPAQRPATQVSGEGQSLVCAQGCSPAPFEQARQRARIRTRRRTAHRLPEWRGWTSRTIG